MSKMRKQSCCGINHYRNYFKNKRIWMCEGMSGIFDFQCSGNSVRIMRNGKGKNNNKNEDELYMSELWLQILMGIRIIGNHSGCHQLPERSFFYKGYQFPVCARCTGVFIGQTGALVCFLAGLRISLPCCAGLLSVMGADWLLQFAGILESTNRRRLLTGIAGGFAVIYFYCCLLKKAVGLLKRNNGG